MRSIFVLFLLILSFNNLFSQTIGLTQVPNKIVPTEFYIQQVIDARADQKAVAYLLNSINDKKVNAVNFSTSLPEAVFQFIGKFSNQNKSLRPVILRINKFGIHESAISANTIAGNLEIGLSFELKNGDDFVKLIEYNGTASYKRGEKDLSAVSRLLSQAISNSLEYFNKWIIAEAATNEYLARSVQLNFIDETQINADTVFYDYKRPLNWKDFKSKPLGDNKYAATVFAFFAVESQNKISNGVIQVDINLKAYVVKNFSWVRDFARNSATLNHEQKHFDIAKIVAERFKKKLQNETLNPDNYEGIISFEYIESLRELDTMQKQYDNETQHGTNPLMQSVWNQKIETELKAFTKSLTN
ncbi:MAG: hypothetical protein ABI390_04245 [Daejeonella sp.]